MLLNIHVEDIRVTEIDETLSENYCRYCYESGSFTEPNITSTEMLDKGKHAISLGQGTGIMKCLRQWSYPMMLKKTSRWSKKIVLKGKIKQQLPEELLFCLIRLTLRSFLCCFFSFGFSCCFFSTFLCFLNNIGWNLINCTIVPVDFIASF